ncbi:Bromodomain-containing protein 7 [Chionoecetes opilio]|uniref:Bromodomain-containing protein 7 n=1 Tax=Chionoecetes opilio TaxID=41210 RepID=A0A8J4YB54_CHIOP|nr:Bromodomain-containing protein 7 [Chionoecetes opilio]
MSALDEETDEILGDFVTYFEATWIGMCSEDEEDGLLFRKNFGMSMKKAFDQGVTIKHSTLCRFVGRLCKEQADNELLIDHANAGVVLPPTKKKYEYVNQRLKNLVEKYDTTPVLEYLQEQEKRDTQINSQLKENANLLEELSREQHERLSRPLPASLNNIAPPSQQELQLVEKVTEGLTQVAKQASPGSLAPVPIVRRAMGITILPVTSALTDSIEVDIEASWGQDKTISTTTTAPPQPTTTGLPTATQQHQPTNIAPQQQQSEQKMATTNAAPRDLESQLSQILHQSEAATPPLSMAMTDSSLREVLNS